MEVISMQNLKRSYWNDLNEKASIKSICDSGTEQIISPISAC